MASGGDDSASVPRSRALVIALIVCATLAFAGLLALGTWQLQRLQWKQDLIARVEQRVHAAPVAAPGLQHWPAVTAASDEYRHVMLNGTYLHEHAVRVQAVTELGGGFWLITPLKRSDG
ncbi:MAG: SURF1 family protein, partial [Herminiimonas sp.]|nr:SURF1 family protein [Herminiimonas sp.]